MKVEITRRTKVGYGINTQPRQTEKGYQFDLPDHPQFTGTIRTVLHQIVNDANLSSLFNTLHSKAWFVRVNGKWLRIKDRYFFDSIHRLIDSDDGQYTSDKITTEVED